MIVPGSANPLLLGDAGYNIQRSLRFRSSASAYLSRIPASAGNQQKFTWSGWVKRGALGVESKLFSAGSSTSDIWYLMFGDNVVDALTFGYWNGSTHPTWLTTTQVFRDPSAFYHIVLSVDTTQVTTANRVLLYVNGTQITSFGTATYPSQNTNTLFNSVTTHYVGRTSSNSTCFDGYLAEVNFIDGQALDATYFGQTDPVTGVWQPKKYGGTYGTNGFYLPFSDNTSATTLAYDKSGNSNNWTPNNISTTAGATYDSMTDVPTLTSATAGNYCVLNPLTKGSSITISNGNLDAVGSVNTNTGNTVLGSIDVSSGKWYAEFKVQNTYSFSYIGVADPANPGSYPGANSTGYSMEVGTGATYNVAAGPTITGAVAGDTVMVALDMDNGKIWWGKNGTWGGTGNPSAGTGQQFSGLTGTKVFMLSAYSSSGTFNANFGQRPFSYTPPTGFKALNTFNLPDPTIKKPSAQMNIALYATNGATINVTNPGGFQPDLVWTKLRDYGYGAHLLTDSVRGNGASLVSNTTGAEGTRGCTISSTGFSYTYPNEGGDGNPNGYNAVAWMWKKGSTPGFDIVTYTGTGATQNVAHSLGVAPKMFMCKNRTGTARAWQVYHASLGNGGGLYLNQTNAYTVDAAAFNNTSPTSSVFTLGNSVYPNESGSTYVAYLFAEIAGFSKFGSYTGNGSADGTFVYCGFRPRYILIKITTGADDWYIYDTVRNTYNATNPNYASYADLPNAETNYSAGFLDVLSNGFKLRANGAGTNASGATMIYAAFAENPFKYSLAR